MLARAAIGFTLLVAFVVLGAWVRRQRGSAEPVVRALVAKVHWTVGVVAIALLVLLAVTAVQVFT